MKHNRTLRRGLSVLLALVLCLSLLPATCERQRIIEPHAHEFESHLSSLYEQSKLP